MTCVVGMGDDVMMGDAVDAVRTRREICCAARARGARVARGVFLGHFLYPRACCCVAVLTETNGNLLPFVSQWVCPVLQTTHLLSKHGGGLWIFGLLGRVVELKQHHVLPLQAFMWGSELKSPAGRARGKECLTTRPVVRMHHHHHHHQHRHQHHHHVLVLVLVLVIGLVTLMLMLLMVMVVMMVTRRG